MSSHLLISHHESPETARHSLPQVPGVGEAQALLLDFPLHCFLDSCLTLNNSNNNRGSSCLHPVPSTVLGSRDSGVSRVPFIFLQELT